MNIIGIETSCDETSVSIVKDGFVLCNVIRTQKIHSKYGGVVPEIASRQHENHIINLINQALISTSIDKKNLDLVSVTYGPGLMGALLVGLNVAKGLAIGLNIPLLCINHLEGHMYANMIDNDNISYPFLCLLVSGGHTQIWEVSRPGIYKLHAKTIDDAAGEAFDKGARILGLKYPGGPEIDKLSKNGDVKKYNFPRPKVKQSKFDFSFSGLKTSLLYKYADLKKNGDIIRDEDLAASFQEAIIDTLIDRIIKVVKYTGIKTISIAGGVAANSRFRYKAESVLRPKDIICYFPKMEYCTDNAAMIAYTAYQKSKTNNYSALDIIPNPNLSLDYV